MNIRANFWKRCKSSNRLRRKQINKTCGKCRVKLMGARAVSAATSVSKIVSNSKTILTTKRTTKIANVAVMPKTAYLTTIISLRQDLVTASVKGLWIGRVLRKVTR